MNKIIGMIKIPSEFDKAYIHDICTWVASVDRSECFVSKSGNTIYFKAETSQEPIDFLYNSTFLNNNNKACERLLSIWNSQSIVPELCIICYNTILHSATQFLAELHPNIIYNKIQITSKKQLPLTDYQLFIYDFEPTINIQKRIGLMCLSKALGISIDVLQNVIHEFPITYIAIWRLFDKKESEKLYCLIRENTVSLSL